MNILFKCMQRNHYNTGVLHEMALSSSGVPVMADIVPLQLATPLQTNIAFMQSVPIPAPTPVQSNVPAGQTPSDKASGDVVQLWAI